jgi:hypothetical protein
MRINIEQLLILFGPIVVVSIFCFCIIENKFKKTQTKTKMPRFNPDPSKVTTGFPVYPKGRYQVTIGEPKSFFKAATQVGKVDNHGVRFASKISGEGVENKSFMISCFMHTPESEGFSKAVQMAALGYNPRDNAAQARFNEEKATLDWTYNTDDASCGDGWHEMKGKVVNVDLDVAMGEGGVEQQKVLGYTPI